MEKATNFEIIIKALDNSGYFQRASYNPEEFDKIVENKLGIGRERALKALEGNGLANFEYDPDPTIHPREKVDYWRVVLTEKGKEIVKSL
ncbi:MAG: hypothetical protein OEZ58_17035 [Gammaproteobacteria bacterium]|nr:hypothetical protein [Gammaproteobacteria bacterium]